MRATIVILAASLVGTSKSFQNLLAVPANVQLVPQKGSLSLPSRKSYRIIDPFPFGPTLYSTSSDLSDLEPKSDARDVEEKLPSILDCPVTPTLSLASLIAIDVVFR